MNGNASGGGVLHPAHLEVIREGSEARVTEFKLQPFYLLAIGFMHGPQFTLPIKQKNSSTNSLR